MFGASSSSSSAIGMLFLLMLLVIIAHCHCWLSPTPRSALRRASPGGEGHETLHDPAVVPSICSSFFRAFEDPTGRAAEEAEGEGEKRERGGGDNFLMVSFSYGWCSGTVVLGYDTAALALRYMMVCAWLSCCALWHYYVLYFLCSYSCDHLCSSLPLPP